MQIDKLIDNIRSKSNPFYSTLYTLYKSSRNVNVPIPKSMAQMLFFLRLLSHEIFLWLVNKFYYEALLRHRCTIVGKNIKCDGDIPLIVGSGRIIIGDNVFIGNKGAWFVAPNVFDEPVLSIGNNTSINYRTVISVESSVTIGNNCLIAEETKIFDNNSHGIDSRNRKMTVEDVSPIVIHDNVWIGMNSIILKGVTIGEGAVVAAGSVVTKDVAPMTLVGGNPARQIKKIDLQ